MTMASTAILRSVNGALLKAFDAWVAEFGMGAAASAFKMPSLIAEAPLRAPSSESHGFFQPSSCPASSRETMRSATSCRRSRF